MRVVIIVGLLTPFLGAFDCSDDASAPVDAGVNNQGFATPTKVTKANRKAGGVWSELGDADWSCLGTATGDRPSTQTIALSGQVSDFQNEVPVGDASITAVSGIQLAGNQGMATSSNVAATRGDYAMNLSILPAGTTRYGFKLDATGWLRTYVLAVYLEPDRPTATLALSAWSESTANALPAFIGVTRDTADGMVVGTMRDCAGHEVSNAIATVSLVSGEPRQLGGADTYYFSASSSSLPVRHASAPASRGDGLFLVLGLPRQTAPAYVQVWGFISAADLADGVPTLLAEQPTPIEANAVITAGLEPRRAQ